LFVSLPACTGALGQVRLRLAVVDRLVFVRRLVFQTIEMAVKVPFEGIYVSRPEPAERSQPRIEFLQRFRPQPVEPALCVDRGFHETSLA
jgi:hypothetical protein